MPDFDTPTLPEPDQPPSRKISMPHLLGLRLGILLVVVLAGVMTVWAVIRSTPTTHQTPAAQLDQEIQLKPPPAYVLADESDSSAFSCEPEDKGYYPSVCFMVPTEATGARQLASITEDMITTPAYLLDQDYGLVLRIRFLDKSEFGRGYGDDIATIYCFERKSVAVSALGSALTDAELVGKTPNCYLTLYRGKAMLNG